MPRLLMEAPQRPMASNLLEHTTPLIVGRIHTLATVGVTGRRTHPWGWGWVWEWEREWGWEWEWEQPMTQCIPVTTAISRTDMADISGLDGVVVVCPTTRFMTMAMISTR
jgi:hypothetical protein